MDESKFGRDPQGSEQSEKDLLKQVEEAGDFLANELRALGTDEETIETRCHLFGQLVFLTLSSKERKTPMELARAYLEKFKPKSE